MSEIVFGKNIICFIDILQKDTLVFEHNICGAPGQGCDGGCSGIQATYLIILNL
jgi:hypothetical protein